MRDIDLTGEPYFAECYILCPGWPPVHGSLLSDLTPLGDRLLFIANDRTHGFAPWVSDGTAEGTRLLADFDPNEQEANSDVLGAVGDTGLFWAQGSGGADGLWLTDGTASGTDRLAMPCDPSCSRWGERGWAFEDQFFFTAYDGTTTHTKLYRFDAGTAAANEVADLCPSGSGFCVWSVLQMVSWNGEIFFNEAASGGSAVHLFRLPLQGGTPSRVAASCSAGLSLLPFGSQLLFVGSCAGGASPRSLYSLDAPDATPRLLHAFADAHRLVAWGLDRAVFTVGAELWITDGTAAGTAPAGFHQALAFTPIGDTLLISGARGGVTGLYALHRSGEITLLRAGAVQEGPQAVGRIAFFAAESPGLGIELWVTDGTPAGTRLYQDIAAGSESSNPGDGGFEHTGFVAAGDRVFFAARDPQHDVELWAAPIDGAAPPPPPCLTSTEVLCLGGRFQAEVAWKDFSGNAGKGRAVPQREVTGAFWFFDSSNLELMVKVLDGRALNGHYWVFYGALTNVEFTLTVVDTQTGRQWIHHNPSGHFASGADTSAFP